MTGGYGVDVGLKRADDLDKKLLAELSVQPNSSVLDLGSGAGGQAARMAEAGARVTAIDIDDYAKEFAALCEINDWNKQQLNFIQGNLVEIDQLLPNQNFDYCLLQRTLHYLPYKAAQKFLEELPKHVGQKLFVSVSGLESDIGKNHPCTNLPIEERFCQLSSDEARKKFFIHESLCLYTPEEFSWLLVDSGWKIKELWVSAFGNVKAVCGLPTPLLVTAKREVG